MFSDVKELFSKPAVFPDTSEYYNTPIFDEVMEVIDSVKHIINYPYSKIGDIFFRIVDLPNKFKIFFE